MVCLLLGVTGLQWRKHLPSTCKVYINDNSAEAIETIVNSCYLNQIHISALHRNGLGKPSDDRRERVTSRSEDDESSRDDSAHEQSHPLTSSVCHIFYYHF